MSTTTLTNSQSSVQEASVQLSTLRTVADPRVLELIILPTEKCNFRCTYCYEDFNIGQMSSGLVNATKKLIASRVNDLDALSISWFGGEPTLALPVVLDITSTARLIFEQQSKQFSSHMTTNAYLLNRETFLLLINAGVSSFQISLDGPADVHNKTRLRADGKATFDVLWSNLLQMASLAKNGCNNFKVRLRIHYDLNTATELPPLIDMIAKDLLPTGCFAVDFHQIEKLGGANDDTISLASNIQHNIVRDLALKIKSNTPTHQVLVAEDIENYVCYASKANSLILRADGRLAKCTVALNDKRNDVGKLNLDGTIEVNNERFSPWIRGLFTGDADTLACPLHGMSAEK